MNVEEAHCGRLGGRNARPVSSADEPVASDWRKDGDVVPGSIAGHDGFTLDITVQPARCGDLCPVHGTGGKCPPGACGYLTPQLARIMCRALTSRHQFQQNRPMAGIIAAAGPAGRPAQAEDWKA